MFDRYGLIPYSRFATFPFHVFWKMLIPYSRISKVFKTDLQDVSARIFSNMFDFPDFMFSKWKIIGKAWGNIGQIYTNIGTYETI